MPTDYVTKDEAGTTYRVQTGIDLTNADVTNIEILKPGGVSPTDVEVLTGSKTGTPTDGWIEYVLDGEFDAAGSWKVRVHVTRVSPAWDYYGQPFIEQVLDDFEVPA